MAIPTLEADGKLAISNVAKANILATTYSKASIIKNYGEQFWHHINNNDANTTLVSKLTTMEINIDALALHTTHTNNCTTSKLAQHHSDVKRRFNSTNHHSPSSWTVSVTSLVQNLNYDYVTILQKNHIEYIIEKCKKG